MWLNSSTSVPYLGSSCLPEGGGLAHCPGGRNPPSWAKSSGSGRARVSSQDGLRMEEVSLKPPAASGPTKLSSKASCCRGSARARPEGSERGQVLSALSHQCPPSPTLSASLRPGPQTGRGSQICNLQWLLAPPAPTKGHGGSSPQLTATLPSVAASRHAWLSS